MTQLLPTPVSEVLSTTEAAAQCGVSPETIRRWIRTKGLPAFNTELGLKIRIRRSDLEAFARQHNILLRDSHLPPGDPLLTRPAQEPHPRAGG
jgi:excisionase family DNA binding protein